MENQIDNGNEELNAVPEETSSEAFETNAPEASADNAQQTDDEELAKGDEK